MKKLMMTLYSASWLAVFASAMFGPIYAVYVTQIGGDLLDAGTAWAIFMLVMGILTLVAGKYEDSIDRRRVVVFGYILLTLATAGYLFVERPWHLFVVQAIFGVGGALLNPAWDALFAKATKKGTESFAWAGIEGGGQIAAGLAALIGSFIATLAGFRALFVVMLCVQALSTLVSLHLLKHTK